MKNQKGFIQIPLLIAIITGVLVLSGVGYFGLKQYQNYQVKQIKEKRLSDEAEKVLQEKEKQAQDLIEAQQKALEETQLELEITKNVAQKTSNQISVLEQKSNSTISAGDLAPYLNGVVQVICLGGGSEITGSGSLWTISGDPFVLTNAHVVSDSNENHCYAVTNDTIHNGVHVYNLDLLGGIVIQNKIDFAKLPVIGCGISDGSCAPISSLDYKISTLPKCSAKMDVGAPVVLIGYPASGIESVVVKGVQGTQSDQIVTSGIISGYSSTAGDSSLNTLLYNNYFVSAKIDSGNSGGIALSKDEKGLCVLGLPTWLTVGNYETQGLVQNIFNILPR